jgi:hypothetical protein
MNKVLAVLVAAVFATAFYSIANGGPDRDNSGLVAHYYKDVQFWGGIWPDTIGAPEGANPASHTFTNYAYSRREPLINHQFVRSGWFTVQWRGLFNTHPKNDEKVPQTHTYEFEVFADDGCRLIIDGRTVIRSWVPMSEESPGARRRASVTLDPGHHEIQIEYFQGQSLRDQDTDPIKLYWRCKSRGIPLQIVPAAHFSHTADHLAAAPGRRD